MNTRHEKRKFPRYYKKVKLFAYAAEAKLKYQVVNQETAPALPKFAAVSKNISASGLCFTCDQKLKKGLNLQLEVYLPKSDEPIHMNGQVRWSAQATMNKRHSLLFNTGVKLLTVEGEPVNNSVVLDKTYHVIWSNVLESIFGTFRKIMQQAKK